MRLQPFAHLALLLLSACTIDEASNPTPRCTTDAECTDGRLCYRGFCVLSDGGAPLDGAPLDGTDGSACDGARAEVCNGEDDDCDGRTDELARSACSTGERGVCAEGHNACPIGGGVGFVCRRDLEPSNESCNGLDDDCDGEVDEDSSVLCYPSDTGCSELTPGAFACLGVCSPGRRRCVEGALTTCEQAREPSAEQCSTDGALAIDEDCDGEIDEGCAACADGAPCFPDDPARVGLGACVAGTLRCGETNTCTGFVRAAPESCANEGADDDCDGIVDNVPRAGTTPGTGEVCVDPLGVGACRTGVTQCVGGTEIACVTPMSMMETCDGTDDDCDGVIDQGFDLMTDRAHCGRCDRACSDGFDCCGGECIDTRSNDAACGACGVTCAAGETCCNGTCADRDSDPAHCGACGNSCGTGACCGGLCEDTRGDELNCGSCGVTCGGATPDCCGGTCSPDGSCDVCTPTCGAGQTCCDGGCHDTRTDELNCGGCGVTCGAGAVCCDGMCVASDEDHCGGSCGACTGSDLCCDGTCVDNNEANCNACGVSCGPGMDCCSTGCRPLDTTTNCGACGVTCGSGQACSNGHCCPSGQAWCGTACVRLDANPNCGRCGRTCALGLCGLCL